MNYIEIIQGDTYTSNFTIKQNGNAIDPSAVSHIYLTSNGCNLQRELHYESTLQKWVLTIPSSITQNLKVGSFNFDLTIKWSDTTIVTAKYEGDIVILAKHNEVNYE